MTSNCKPFGAPRRPLWHRGGRCLAFALGPCFFSAIAYVFVVLCLCDDMRARLFCCEYCVSSCSSVFVVFLVFRAFCVSRWSGVILSGHKARGDEKRRRITRVRRRGRSMDKEDHARWDAGRRRRRRRRQMQWEKMDEENNARWDAGRRRRRHMQVEKTKEQKQGEKYDKTKLSKLGRSVFEPTFQEMSKLRREIVQNREKSGYSHRNVSTENWRNSVRHPPNFEN